MAIVGIGIWLALMLLVLAICRAAKLHDQVLFACAYEEAEDRREPTELLKPAPLAEAVALAASRAAPVDTPPMAV